MHRSASQNSCRSSVLSVRLPAGNSGFSLVEVTLAIGIIAFAFVALFGLLPTGMQTFRASVNATNDITIIQEMNAMVQVTRWKFVDKLDQNRGGDIYYFDEEGRRTDTKRNQSDNEAVKARRLYQVKLFVEEAYQPGVESKNPDPKKEYKDAKRIVVVIGDLRGKETKAERDFESVKKSSDLIKDGKSLDVRSRSFIVARMESENDVD